MGLENEPWWDELLAKKDSTSLRELAEEFGVSVGALSLALKRTKTRKEPQSEAPEPSESSTLNRPGSKDYLLVPFLERLGTIPDAEVAEAAGVSMRTVASYRARNDISGFTGRSRVRARKKRASKIDPFADMVGTVPDRVVAEQAGVTLNAVRNFRTSRGIPSARESARDGTITPPPLRASSPGGSMYAWQVTFENGTSGVVGANGAADAISRVAGKGEVVEVRRLDKLL